MKHTNLMWEEPFTLESAAVRDLTHHSPEYECTLLADLPVDEWIFQAAVQGYEVSYEEYKAESSDLKNDVDEVMIRRLS